jgi:ribose-phosphate pyrophosphokinase
MKVLNLSPGLIDLGSNYLGFIEHEKFYFNGGEPHIKIDVNSLEDEVMICIRLTSIVSFGYLLVAVDALRRTGLVKKLGLFSPYFPGARQDSVMNPGEPLTVKVFADIINSMNLDMVIIADPHSKVTSALINNCQTINLSSFYNDVVWKMGVTQYTPIMLIAPDAGADKRVKEVADELIDLGYSVTTAIASKSRDTSTGEIVSYEFNKEIPKDAKCLVIDDICDGGATFNLLGKELKNKGCEKLYLVVTHGIFSKGFKELSKWYNAIYTTSSFVNNYSMEIPEIEKKSEIVTILPFTYYR